MRQLDARTREVPKIAEAVHLLTRTRWGEVTLTPGATTTVVTDPTVTPDTVLQFVPMTTAAATELYGSTMVVLEADLLLGSFKITHANSAVTDRKFRWIAAGD